MLWRRVLPLLGMRLAPGPAQPVAWGMQTRRAILQAAGRLRYFLQCRRLRCSRVRVSFPMRNPPAAAWKLHRHTVREALQCALCWGGTEGSPSVIFGNPRFQPLSGPHASMHRLSCSASPALAWQIFLGRVHKHKLAGWVLLWAD